MKQKIILLVLFFVTASLIFLANKREFEQQTDLYLNEVTQRTQSEYAAMVESYKFMTKSVISEVIMQPEVLALYKDAYEGDPLEQQQIRSKLHELLSEHYEFLVDNNIRQLHFHLPDNRSFLRFHRPDRFGDDLSDIRYSVKLTNLTKEPHFGFEEGRIFNGFRNVYPLIWNNTHIGSVEISFSFKAFETYSTIDNILTYNLLVREETVLSKVFTSEQENYSRSPLLEGFVYETATHVHLDERDDLIDSFSIHRKSIEQNVAANNDFTLIHKANSGYYSVTFLNVRNLQNTPVAYLYTFRKEPKLAVIKRQHTSDLLVNLGVLMIVFTLLYYLLIKKEKLRDKDLRLIRSEKRYQRIINRMTDVYFRTDLDQNLIMISPSGAHYLGYEHANQLIGKNVPDSFLMNPEDSSRFLDALNSSKGEIKDFEVLLKNRYGDPLAFEANSQYVRSEDGTVTGVEGILRNVVAKKEAQIKIEKYTKELEIANSTKNTFFSIIAHDLKNPFMAILGLTELLKLNFKNYSDDQVQEMIELIDTSGKNTYKLLEQLLDWSRIQTGRIHFDPDHHEIEPVIDEVLLHYEHASTRKNIALVSSVHSHTDPVTIYADRNLLATIIRNLVSNAIKFTPSGGQVMVEVNQTFLETVFTVSDTGTGIPDDIRARLFKIEEKVSTCGTNNEQGTGLGLLLCKEFVEKHSGSIEVSSTEGRGSRFIVTIPHKFEVYAETIEAEEEMIATA